MVYGESFRVGDPRTDLIMPWLWCFRLGEDPIAFDVLPAESELDASLLQFKLRLDMIIQGRRGANGRIDDECLAALADASGWCVSEIRGQVVKGVAAAWGKEYCG